MRKRVGVRGLCSGPFLKEFIVEGTAKQEKPNTVKLRMSGEDAQRLIAACRLMVEMSDITLKRMRSSQIKHRKQDSVPSKAALEAQQALISYWQGLREKIEAQL